MHVFKEKKDQCKISLLSLPAAAQQFQSCILQGEFAHPKDNTKVYRQSLLKRSAGSTVKSSAADLVIGGEAQQMFYTKKTMPYCRVCRERR